MYKFDKDKDYNKSLEMGKSSYSEEGFWEKLKSYATVVGSEGILMALKLFYALKMGKLSVKDSAIVIGALGYFILPIDILPDFIPLLGYTDDLTVLAAALSSIDACKDPEVVQAAEQKMKEWFN